MVNHVEDRADGLLERHEVDRKEFGRVREEVLRLYPKTKTIISICKHLNPENIQGISRSLANFIRLMMSFQIFLGR